MDPETFAALLAAEGQALLATVSADERDPLQLGTRLREAGHRPELVAAATSVSALRRRARTKLGADASHLYLTAEALEQATRHGVAEHRASRLERTGVRTLVDLGCGVGADLIAFARAGIAADGVDRDPVRVAMARANLEALGLRGTVTVADATQVDVTPYDVAFVDPARRGPRGRTFDPDAFSPPWSFVAGLLDDRGVAKVLPGLDHDLVPDGVEAEWVSESGDLVEACLWGRRYADAARRASVLHADGLATLTDADLPDDVPLAPPLDYLYEPDDAVLRAGLVAALADRVDGGLLDPHIAYVTSSAHVATPLARAYRVVEELPYREKALRSALRARDAGALTVKKRGVSVVPEQLVRRLGLKGSTPTTVVLTRVAGEGRAFLVERVATPPRASSS